MGKLKSFFKKVFSQENKSKNKEENNFLIFEHMGTLVRAQKILQDNNLSFSLKAPPPELLAGCEMVIEFPKSMQAAFLSLLAEHNIKPLKILNSATNLSGFENKVLQKHFHNFIMFRTANMKLSVEKTSGIIVNVSGGGCPDIPILAENLIGKKISETAAPIKEAKSLCAFSLNQAWEEAKKYFEPLNLANTYEKQILKKPKKIEFSKKDPLKSPWLVVGTVLKASNNLTLEKFTWEEGKLLVGPKEVEITCGTTALMAAYAICAKYLCLSEASALLAYDSGDGQGSKLLYNDLLTRELNYKGLTFHYLFPDVENQIKLDFKIQKKMKKPLLVADAGFMYGSKLTGLAEKFDIFTPDAGELAYLADDKAVHPFYTESSLWADEINLNLIKTTFALKTAAKCMLVKGSTDYIVSKNNYAIIETPQVPEMEAIGGTGDTLTGMVSAFLAAGYALFEASLLACTLNRQMGKLAKAQVDDSIADLIKFLPLALANYFEVNNKGV